MRAGSTPKPPRKSQARVKGKNGTGSAGQKRTVFATVGAAQAKAHFLSIAERVHASDQAVTVTKRGVPFVRVAPVDEPEPPASIIGCMKGTVSFIGDIVGPEPDAWEAML